MTYRKKIFKKKKSGEVVLQYDEIFTTDVHFESDPAKIQWSAKNEDINLSLAELLIGFFHFYSEIFEPYTYAITTSDP